MPPFSTDDYHKLLQKIAVLETKILRLEVNVEVNGQYGNETTLPMTQISGKEQANRQMLCAKPRHNSCKDKSLPSDMGRRLTGRTLHLLSGLHCRHTGGSLQPQYQGENSRGNVAKTKSKSKPTKDTGILLENRFAPILQDPDSPKERSSSSTGESSVLDPGGLDPDTQVADGARAGPAATLKADPKTSLYDALPSLYKKIGPLMHMWSMRFEAKHKVFQNQQKNSKCP
ncbi:hypothetical protein N1851_032898 [Merluccius polli]|uniref:Uncharacterized protein n=1 Tax=Merluccius polli TaxID=89951 RepID=A0AA47M2E8_MERPO|nr:hypothetical protein N1851_032898 [Merluccius polli]